MTRGIRVTVGDGPSPIASAGVGPSRTASDWSRTVNVRRRGSRPLEARTTRTGAAQTRTRDSEYEQKIRGAYAQFGKAFEFGGSRHFLTYGADYYETDNVSLRNGATFGANGAPAREFYPYPTRDFPPTKVVQAGALVQDEIALFDGRLLLSPGVRFDRFDADAAPDAVYFGGNPGSPPPEDYADSEVTAKVGAVWAAGRGISVFARYSEGFRAPPYDDVNVGFTNFLGRLQDDIEFEPILGAQPRPSREACAGWGTPANSA